MVVVDHRDPRSHLQLCNCGGGNIPEVDGSDDSGGDDGGGDEHHRDHHHPPCNHLESHYLCWKIQSRRMLIPAHLQSPVHAFYELSIIGNHHQMVDGDDGHHGHSHHDGHGDHSPGGSHRDHSLPWLCSDCWGVEVAGRARFGSTSRQRSLRN